MPRTGKCPNYAGCLLAYRNEDIVLPDDVPFICPECKQPLVERGRVSGRAVKAIPIMILGGISLLVIMGAIAVYIQVLHFRHKQAAGQIGTSFEDAEVAASHGEFLPSRHMTTVTGSPTPDTTGTLPAGYQYLPPSPTPAPPDEPPPSAPAPDTDSGVQAQAPNMNLQDAQNQAVKDDVLKRIDLMPSITSDDKDKLYMSVERARQMGKIITIPFPSGHVALSPDDVDQLRAVLASTQIQPFLKDPTCVLVVLGFADVKGDQKVNLHISTERATAVMNALRDRCGVLNVLHAIGMGGSTLFGSAKDAERNRVVEIWAVLP